MNRTSLLLLALPFAPAIAHAQAAPPDAGKLLQELRSPPLAPPRAPATTVEERPAARGTDGQRIAVSGFRITGTTVFSEADLLPLLSDGRGKTLSLSELDALAMRITRHYRDAGYLVARAYLPPQDIKDGVVEIAVVEGRLGAVKTANAIRLAPSALAPLDALKPGDVITTRALEGSLLALSELPGVDVKSVLRPGTAMGTSDMLVDLAPGRAFSGSADFDSFGNRFTGAYRLGTSLYWNNPANLGDQASLRLQTSGSGFSYSRLGYQLPLGVQATRLGASWSEMHYTLGESFAPLHASGNATVGSVYVLHPFLRSREATWTGQVQYDDKRMEDRVGSTGMRADKTVRDLTLSLNGNFTDGLGGGGSNSVGLGYVSGHLTLDTLSAAIDQATARSQGEFAKWSATLQRSQRLPEDFVLIASYNGQWAGKNLDSSEKLSLGGAQGVRAYPQGEASGDEGQLVTLELRRPIAAQWEAQAFYDDGRITINHQPWTTAANSRHLAGYGLGATYAGGGFTVRMFAAWKANTGRPTSDTDRTPRLWVQGVMYF